ncbi:MAG: tetratricopeptide repeat protein [Bacteroidia bacterium]|nr:tetratricopeptide repeat protein [Bacteroidia bacterium]
MKGAQLRGILIAGTVLLSVALYFAPSQVNQDGTSPKEAHEGHMDGLNPDDLLRSARVSLDTAQLKNLDFFEASLKKAGNKDTALLDGIGRFWDRNGVPAASAIWFERKAEIVKSEQSYLDAAYRYFDSFRMANDTAVRSILVGKAIASYKKVLEINPGNLNAKTDLGACYADGTSEPMKGIMLLREVIAADPNHEMAQYNLGMLSVKSGQLDKAIERFNKVLEINPGRNEVHFFIGQVFLQKGDTAQAIRSYETFIRNAQYDVSDVIKMVETLKKKPA